MSIILELLSAFETLNPVNQQQDTIIDVDFKAETIIPEHKVQQIEQQNERQLHELYEQQRQKQVDEFEQRNRLQEQQQLQNQNSYYRCASNSITFTHESIVDKTDTKKLLYSCWFFVTIAIIIILIYLFVPISQQLQSTTIQSSQLFARHL